MTRRGSLVAIALRGIDRADTDALMKCLFTETVEIIEVAAVGERDDCHGTAEKRYVWPEGGYVIGRF